MMRRFFVSTLIMVMVQVGMMAGAKASDLVMPDPSIAPGEVVAIQLKALQFNDNPINDFGIAQTWSFAHPNNRAMTGPLPRFAAMIKSPGYASLIDHNRHTISQEKTALAPGSDDPNIEIFNVFMEGKTGQTFLLQWVVERVTEGEYSDCWMTVSVSAPVAVGLGS
ncbi:hypothetical protein N8835_00090 [Alphaproteobacteria bacterium]|nr:hypothetical protein [Alphaproteobacteria bacterium]